MAGRKPVAVSKAIEFPRTFLKIVTFEEIETPCKILVFKDLETQVRCVFVFL